MKNWYYSIEGGIIALIFYFLFVYTSPVLYFGASPNILGVILSFVIGAIIGFIVGKIKLRKKNSRR